MANEDQLRVIRQGVDAWNRWRKENPDVKVDLSRANFHDASLCDANFSKADLSSATFSFASLCGANLRGANLRQANLKWANLIWADFNEANLRKADISWANLIGANLIGANLCRANLMEVNLRNAAISKANLMEANLCGANLMEVDLTDTDLSAADLSRASLVETTLVRTKLTGCRIYGISAWELKLDETEQKDLIITPESQPTVTVDNIEVAQFVYLLLHNKKIRQVIDTITSKVVLILGRFTPERKVVLDAIREELRERGYVPALFDFDKPESRNLTETISTLAHMARFIIADITDAKSIPAEMQCIVPNLPSVPVMPLVLRSDNGYALFDHIRSFGSVLEPYQYESQEE